MPYEDEREGLFDEFATDHDLVVLGDSISERIDWSGALGRPVVNRAFAGNTVASAVRRAPIKARVILMMFGINDLLRGRAAKDVAASYVALIEKLAAGGARVVVTSTVTGRADLADAVTELNAIVRNKCGCTFVDIRPALGGERIKSEYSADGIHLTAEGYRVWLSELRARLAAI